MFNKKQKNSPKVSSLANKGLSFEEDKELMFKRSNRNAWAVAAVSVALLIGQSICSDYKLNKIVEAVSQPTILGFDRSTGIVEPISVISKDTIVGLNAQEALDKHFVNQYIQNRESYSYQTIQQTYDLTQIFSSEQVADDYRKEFSKETALDKALGTGTAQVKVVSITLENIGGENIATARIVVNYKDAKKIEFVKNFTIRMSYEYNPSLGLELAERINNPMGFFVTSYQRVQESL
ncbi:type IV secretion system protein [Aggregatibacter actinomycetemcomitans]|nr:type IV secretion system protein [Aggregatibacter actinomycetemcomitans]MBN6078454.1 type IV secretion system protein [Aggregatibacter actinomycetemcomitans]MBN6078474.1 type IV secretion system protein [Aggregatibacter actinomycetemcomitans]MBN6078857.1 type IV secretion system protein [Aggregatibacter actinomycetemcomitans]MBN6080097.1 type IV secretion system protein [Aggregatibacter actinomycetemcomitans]